jgi:hypothetical protein
LRGLVRAILKDSNDNATATYLDSDGYLADSSRGAPLAGATNTSAGAWNMITLTTRPEVTALRCARPGRPLLLSALLGRPQPPPSVLLVGLRTAGPRSGCLGACTSGVLHVLADSEKGSNLKHPGCKAPPQPRTQQGTATGGAAVRPLDTLWLHHSAAQGGKGYQLYVDGQLAAELPPAATLPPGATLDGEGPGGTRAPACSA